MNDFGPERAAALTDARRALCIAALNSLINGDSGVLAATVSTIDGLELAAAGMVQPAEAGKLAAITSSLQALGAAVASELALGSVESVAIEARDGRMLCVEISLDGQSLILAVVAAKKALLALTFISTRACATRIASGWAACSTGAIPAPRSLS